MKRTCTELVLALCLLAMPAYAGGTQTFNAPAQTVENPSVAIHPAETAMLITLCPKDKEIPDKPKDSLQHQWLLQHGCHDEIIPDGCNGKGAQPAALVKSEELATVGGFMCLK